MKAQMIERTGWVVYTPWYNKILCKIGIHLKKCLGYEKPNHVTPGMIIPAFEMCFYCGKDFRKDQ